MWYIIRESFAFQFTTGVIIGLILVSFVTGGFRGWYEEIRYWFGRK